MLLLLTIWQSFPISVNSEIVLKLPIVTLSPIITLSSITLKAPIETLLPIFAVARNNVSFMYFIIDYQLAPTY